MNLLRGLKFVALPFVVGALSVFIAATAKAQEPVGEQELSLDETVLRFDEDRQQRTLRAMSVLLGWSVANIGVGTVGYFQSEGATRHFHEMNVGWNVVNAAIAGFGLFGALRDRPGEGNAIESLDEGRHLEKILLLNMGLNVAYIATGAYLWERGIHRESERLRGYGPSLIVQGGFLLLFDTTLFLLQNRSTSRYQDALKLHWSHGPGLSYQRSW